MKLKNLTESVFCTLLIVFGVIGAITVPSSCRITEDGITILEGDLSSPKILSFKMADSKNLLLVCSEKIKVENVNARGQDGSFFFDNVSCEYLDDDTCVKFTLSESTLAGKDYIIDGCIKDLSGNSLSFSLPFVGFNCNPCSLVLSEIRTKHSASSGVIKKAEFIELYVLKEGNTVGYEIISGSDGEEKKYIFPAIDVKKGEYIVVHYRTVGEGECINETGENLELSTGTDSSSGRDLWINNTEGRISDNDVIALRDACRNKLVDGVLFSSSSKTDWYYSGQKYLAKELVESGLWIGDSSILNSVCSDGISLTRTISRLNLSELIENGFSPSCKMDWSLVSGATPGAENSNAVYTK